MDKSLYYDKRKSDLKIKMLNSINPDMPATEIDSVIEGILENEIQ